MTMITGKQLAKQIKHLAAKNKISIKQVLSDCKINRNYIYDLENKINFPPWEKVLIIANYFNVTTDYLLGVSDNPKSNELPDSENELLTHFRQLSESQKSEVKGYIKGLLSHKPAENISDDIAEITAKAAPFAINTQPK